MVNTYLVPGTGAGAEGREIQIPRTTIIKNIFLHYSNRITLVQKFKVAQI